MTDPITPDEAMKPDQAAVDAGVEAVGRALGGSWTPYERTNGRVVQATILGPERDAVADVFRAAGWAVTYQSDQRDGAFYWFKRAIR